MATSEANAKRAKGETAGIFPGGTEYKVRPLPLVVPGSTTCLTLAMAQLLTGDATIGQALIAIMSESYVEFVKAIWKMNKSYKIFMGIFKTVFPEDVSENDSLHDIFTRLNDRYVEHSTKPQAVAESSGGFFSSWGRKKPSAVTAPHLRHANSSSAIPTISSSAAANGDPASAASAPVSELPSRSASTIDLSTSFNNKVTLADSAGDAEVDSYPSPLWAGDPLTKLVISGAALGSGMFGLIFSMLPPKMRKMISWFGFSNSNRPVALKLLTVAASSESSTPSHQTVSAMLTRSGCSRRRRPRLFCLAHPRHLLRLPPPDVGLASLGSDLPPLPLFDPRPRPRPLPERHALGLEQGKAGEVREEERGCGADH